MSTILPINLDDLLHCRGVESERVEFKESWNVHHTGPQVVRTICAFANDYHNLNGGYVAIGVGERHGCAELPPAGLSVDDLDAAQKWLRGRCSALDPPYFPVLSPETVGDRLILVVWAPGSDTRAHRAPDRSGSFRDWVRLGAETVNAETRPELLRGLLQQTARVPWDDRRANDAAVEDLREAKVREYLRDVRSGLLHEPNERDLYRRMRLTVKVNDHEIPRNTGLLFFSRDPTEWFRGAKIEVVQFAADRAGDVQEERIFGGGLVDQLRDCLNYLENLSAFHLQKQADRSQVRGWVSYPMQALRETLVNAVYHRSYDVDQPEPTKVYLFPDRIEVISYPGPVPGVEPGHLLPNAQVRAAPARNRRIGEFLKELKLAEGRLSGLPKVYQAMAANGSPVPEFVFDEQRTYFQATLPAHPEYGALSALRDAAHLKALGEHAQARSRVATAWESNQNSGILAAEMIDAYAASGELDRAEEVLETFKAQGPEHAVAHVENRLIEAFVEAGRVGRARKLLTRSRPVVVGQDAIDAAILARRTRDSRIAHRYFERAGDVIYADPRALHEFAQTKLWLATEAHRQRRRDLNRRFLTEARPLLERVIQLEATPTRHAWAWRDVARTLNWLRAPLGEVEAAYRRATELLPDEPRFVAELRSLQAPRNRVRSDDGESV